MREFTKELNVRIEFTLQSLQDGKCNKIFVEALHIKRTPQS